MSKWVQRGIATGVRTTGYPKRPETAPGVSPGLPASGVYTPAARAALAARCPTGALRDEDGRLVFDPGRCVHCHRCLHQTDAPVDWSPGYEWARWHDPRAPHPVLDPAFQRSTHIIVVDAGDCGACLHEVKQLNNPYYNMHRLGFFLTPTPRHADVLVVVGPVTDHMRVALQKTYDAMPTPKRVMAVGSCALTGGVFGPNFVTGAGVADVLPVDLEVPGQPPPPLAILHGLLVLTGRAQA